MNNLDNEVKVENMEFSGLSQLNTPIAHNGYNYFSNNFEVVSNDNINNKLGNIQYAPYDFTTTFVGNCNNQDEIIENSKIKKQVPLEYYWDKEGYNNNNNNFNQKSSNSYDNFFLYKNYYKNCVRLRDWKLISHYHRSSKSYSYYIDGQLPNNRYRETSDIISIKFRRNHLLVETISGNRYKLYLNCCRNDSLSCLYFDK